MNKKDKIQIAVTGILIIFLLFLLGSMGKSKKKMDIPLKEQPAKLILTVPVDNYSKIEEETRPLEIKRDPFSKEVVAIKKSAMLSGIFWDDKIPTAIVNGKVVKQGDMVEEYKVLNIDKNTVILNDGTKDIRLDLKK